MPTFQFLLHTSGIQLEFEGDASPAIGFYSVARIKARNWEEGFETLMTHLDEDPEMKELLQSGHNAGLQPKTEIEEYFVVPWFRSILPWKPPGRVFYESDQEE